jgi:ferredoxin-NADP reductase
LDNFSYHAIDAGDAAAAGKAAGAALLADLPDSDGADVYVVGATAFVDAVVSALLGGGVTRPHIVTLVL